MRALFDTNIVLDAFLERAPFVADARLLWQQIDDGKLTAFLPASVLTDIYYIIRRQAGQQKAAEAVRICLDTFAIVPVDTGIVQKAIGLAGTDFEDNVQIACAEHELLDAIITRDKAGFKESAVDALTPTEALAQLGVITS
jgi:predicted nucleic acid-binding protein